MVRLCTVIYQLIIKIYMSEDFCVSRFILYFFFLDKVYVLVDVMIVYRSPLVELINVLFKRKIYYQLESEIRI